MTKNIFITGGLGQDGQIITDLLKNKNVNTYIFSKYNKNKFLKNTKFIKTNLLNKKKLDKFFSKIKPDIVLHLAANNPSFSEKSYNKFFKQNFVATKNIFHSTFKANTKAKFIFCNSSQIFKKKKGIVNESSKVISTSDYTNFRIKSDLMMQRFKIKNKIAYTNVILFNHDSIYRNKKFIIPRIIDALIKKNLKFIKMIINENIHSDFSHAEDICKGLFKIMFSKNNFDNIILSSGKNTSLNKIILYIIKKYSLKIKTDIKKIKNKKTLIGNNKFAKQKLKWFPKKNIYIAASGIYKSQINK